jgi:hypothetical protein
MDSLTRYMIFFLACMATIILLTYLPDRGDKRPEATETMERELALLRQIED